MLKTYGKKLLLACEELLTAGRLGHLVLSSVSCLLVFYMQEEHGAFIVYLLCLPIGATFSAEGKMDEKITAGTKIKQCYIGWDYIAFITLKQHFPTACAVCSCNFVFVIPNLIMFMLMKLCKCAKYMQNILWEEGMPSFQCYWLIPLPVGKKSYFTTMIGLLPFTP